MGLTLLQEMWHNNGDMGNPVAFARLRDESQATADWANDIANAMLREMPYEQIERTYGHYPTITPTKE